MRPDVLRTPESHFEDLPDYPFAPHYVEIDGLRMHFVDEGPPNADPVLLLHGEPSWSYLYRHMIPILVGAGHRVLAPDLIGFGKSDKPTDRARYTYAAHVGWVKSWIGQLDLERVTLFAQDWGSLIGLRVAAECETRFARLVIGNGGLPTGDGPVPRAFALWRAFARWSPWFPVSRIVAGGTARALSEDERRAYDAPFPSSRHKMGARVFPLLVPTRTSDPAVPDNQKAWQVLEAWEKPFLTAFSDGDPITRGMDRGLQERIPGAAGIEHVTVRGGHFLQEDSGPELAGVINRLMAQSPLPARSD